MRRHTLVPLLALVTLAACTTGEAGTPVGLSTTTTRTQDPAPGSKTSEPSTPSAPASSTELPTDGAPKVKNPVDVSKFANDPCASLPPERAQVLVGTPTGKRTEHPTGAGCRWFNNSPDTFNGSSIDVHFFSQTSKGLTAVYRANKRGEWAYFEPVADINGMPAVTYDKRDNRDIGMCGVDVGMSDTMSIGVITQQSLSKRNRDQACQVAVMVAAEVVKTLKAG
ncbi:Protein of unknown function [Actinokineospora iranica]|uniref:DUF3558 domain-containing protein n=1 Tax=Actinokineospora iranica TaxID=1271860 RepID=A0A1G6Q420_9PSEU|nr:Protein of unknown function [Actinokineospora iranica]